MRQDLFSKRKPNSLLQKQPDEYLWYARSGRCKNLGRYLLVRDPKDMENHIIDLSSVQRLMTACYLDSSVV